MPGQFTDKNGGNMAGHSDKWSDKNRRPNSYQAGQGSRGSRNQGTGDAGRANTVATDTVDTSKMSKEDKLKYFNSLGLLTPAQKQEIKPEPVQQAPAKATPSTNPVKELSDKLGKIFASKPQLIQGIVKALQAVPKEQLRDKAQAVLSSMEGNSSTEPTEVFSTIMKALEGKPAAEPEVKEPEPERRMQSGKMTEKEFRETNAYLGQDFVDSIIKQVKQFKDFERALFTVDLAIENVDDVNDARAVRNSMASAADDLGSQFEMVDKDEPEEGSIDWIRKIHQYAFDNGRFHQPFESYKSYQDLLKNNHDLRIFQDYMEMIPKNPKTKPLYDLAMHKLNDFDSEEGEDSKFLNIGDAIFSILKDGEDVQQSSGTDSEHSDSTDSVQQNVSQLGAGSKRAYEQDPEAYNAPTVEEGLKLFQAKRDFSADLKRFLEYVAENMKAEGAKPAQINKNIAYYMSELKGNYFKFLKAQNAMIDNGEAYDPDDEMNDSEFQHNMMSFESALEDYNRGDITTHEKGFIELYNYLHGK